MPLATALFAHPALADTQWTACGGACQITQRADRLEVAFGDTVRDLSNARLLHGQRPTACLSILPVLFSYAPNTATLLRTKPDTAELFIGPEIVLSDIALAPETARLSCNAAYLIVQDVFGTGGVLIFDTATGDPIMPSQGTDSWLLTSPDGSYAVEIASFNAFDGYRIVELDTGQSTELPATHEIDLPAFGTDNSFALVRGDVSPPRTEIYDLSTGELAATLDYALPLGRPFKLEDGEVVSTPAD
ncbi:hypothetical protein C8N43_2745 [Litoreibacter ponti]|uniref:Uncharacterized protein n=2 Tax=Litoreibacter ponti TaxID=1510457 RepID=A0A2T6BPT5_9RHOB|nr:hypothetical protein C8N43_2745 [Litoreibacter ponti]